MRGTPGSAYPQPEPNATELPSSAPGRPKFIELQASAPSPTPTRAEEHIATTPDCRPRVPAPSPTPTRTEHLSGLQIVRLCALARRRAPKRTAHYTCCCEIATLHVKRQLSHRHGRAYAAQTVQHLPCGLGPSDLWLVSAPTLIVRIRAQRGSAAHSLATFLRPRSKFRDSPLGKGLHFFFNGDDQRINSKLSFSVPQQTCRRTNWP